MCENGLRIWRVKPWGFESPLSHQSSNPFEACQLGRFAIAGDAVDGSVGLGSMLPIRCPNSSCCPFSIFNAASARSASLMMNRYFPAGILSLTATYNGDSQLGRSISAPLSQVIHQATSTTGIKSSLNPSVLGGSVTFTATVSSATASAVPGTVTFRKGSTILGTVTLSSRKANFTTSALPRGSFTIKATYNGSPNIIGSAASLIQVVN